MKIISTKKIILAVVTAVVMVSVLPFLQSCSNKDSVLEQNNSGQNQQSKILIANLKKDFNLKESQNEIKSIIKFDNADSARKFLEQFKGIQISQKLSCKSIRFKANQLETTTTGGKVSNNTAASCVTSTVNNVLPYFPGADFQVSINYSTNPPTLKAQITGFNWGYTYNIDASKVTYSNGVYTFGISGSTSIGVDILGHPFTYSTPSQVNGYINTKNNTSSMTTIIP